LYLYDRKRVILLKTKIELAFKDRLII